VVTLVADNLKRQWFWVVYFGLETNCIKQLERKLVQIILQELLQILTTKHLWGSHLLPSGHENFHDDQVIVTLRMFPGLSVRKSVTAAWQVSYAISLWYQSKPRVT